MNAMLEPRVVAAKIHGSFTAAGCEHRLLRIAPSSQGGLAIVPIRPFSAGSLGVRAHAYLADPILAAVNDNGLPGNECSIVACQEQDRARHILGFSQPLDRLLFPSAAFLPFRLSCSC